jgi:UDP-N-acetylmuramoylalanine-D-glutamate ligase
MTDSQYRMRVLVCGGRDFIDYELFQQAMTRYVGHLVPVIIQGGAKGADFLAKVWAHKYNLECVEYQPDWDKHKKAAGIIRNKEMLESGKPDVVIAFPGGSGTANMIDIAKKAGIRVIEIAE